MTVAPRGHVGLSEETTGNSWVAPPSPHHCPGRPTTENYSAPNVSSGQAEKPCQAGGNERCVHLANEKREGPQGTERETHVLVLSGFRGLTFRVTVHMLFAIFNPSLNCQCPPLRFFPLSL